MAKPEGGTVGKLWKKHGGGYYALSAVGTFLYLEVANLVDAVAKAGSMTDLVLSELVGFFIDAFINTFLASAWPLIWYSRMGISAVFWAVGGYLVWAFLLAFALSRRERQMRSELGLD
jgi:hypothetical protein